LTETFSALASGFSIALTPINLLWGFIGVTLGTFIGVLPGVGPALTVAMLMPLTVKLDPTGALIMFAGIYYGAMYGGSTTTILLNTPGESASIATALEGNLMAKNGRAGPALATCAIGSFVAGTIATVLVTVLAPIVVELALRFGPAEYFALMIFAFTTVTAVIGASTARGVTSLFLGLLLGVIGIDGQTGRSRFAFGVPELLDGIDVVVLAVGLFAVGEALYVAAYYEPAARGKNGTDSEARCGCRSATGSALGRPGCARPRSAFRSARSRLEARRFRRSSRMRPRRKLTNYPEEFGNGAIEGVAGPEAANNASATGALVPLSNAWHSDIGDRGECCSAAFQNYGIQPGPLLFQIAGRSRVGAAGELVYRQRFAVDA
jgi:putative tricarboxylic transport membrane protein